MGTACNKPVLLAALASCLLLAACGGENTSSNVQSPGEEKSGKTRVLEAGAAALQDKTPLQKMNIYLDGFHFYNGNLKGQMEAHHYCTKLNEDLTQCVIFDGNGENAKIMGVEYIISEKLFKTLPEGEKKLWHSHVHEVKSGTLVAPGIPDAAEHELMEQIVSTYGKTFHPLLMAAFIKDGQLDTNLIIARDRRFGISTAEKRRNRADIATPPVQPGADAWKNGEVRQLKITNDASAVQAHDHR